MSKALNNVLHVTDLISLLIILPGFIFITAVNFLDWRKSKRLDVSEQLISGLGLLSLIHRIFQVSFRSTVLFHGLNIFSSSAWLSIDITYLSLIFSTLLFSSLLAIHFCLKIVNVNQNLYIYIQHRFPKIYPWVFFPSTLVSLLISGPAASDMSKLVINGTALLNPNFSPLKTLTTLKLYFVSSSVCFLIFLISVVVTVVSLNRHIQRMQANEVNFRAESVEAHVTAVKTLIALLVFNLLYFGLVIATVEDYGRLQWMHILLIVYAFFHVFSYLFCYVEA
ncbi:taste receptor type 2 member 4-like [Anomaloglossus baeobatrachus]|uniref:taste receptor type 2 member 4-like n=1 Tax=Anomaloglossus baeobatrachus TaxID=238106 RepID=UPI003F4F9A6A